VNKPPYWTAAGRRACIVCGRDAGPDGRCHQHKKRRPWYGKDWPAVSRQRRIDHPICEICGKRPSVATDHVIPRSRAGGIRAVCQPCHQEHGQQWDPSYGEPL
jgi:5-methylcytosine-specific restriction endonuclease McrA